MNYLWLFFLLNLRSTDDTAWTKKAINLVVQAKKHKENKIKAAQNFISHIQSNYYKTSPVPVQTTISWQQKINRKKHFMIPGPNYFLLATNNRPSRYQRFLLRTVICTAGIFFGTLVTITTTSTVNIRKVE